jgi:hypothetical protein
MVYTLEDLHSVVTIKLILLTLTGSFRLCHAPLQGKRPTNVLTDSDDGRREGEGEVRAAAAYITQAVE